MAPRRNKEDDGKAGDAEAPLKPWQTSVLIGQEAHEAAFLAAFGAGTLHHAWLLTGERGIGKATFAYLAAKFLLSALEARRETLAGDLNSPVSRQIAAGAHPALFVLGEKPGEAEPATQSIGVDDIRKLKQFLSLTSTAGWRAVIVDAANDLTTSSANALLKGIEEPPKRTAFFLISHGAGAVMPTIRSRCSKLRFGTLAPSGFANAMRQALSGAPSMVMPSEGEIAELYRLSGGAPGRALRLLTSGLLSVSERLDTIIQGLPKLDRSQVHEFVQSTAGSRGPQARGAILDLFEEKIESLALGHAKAGSPASDAWAEYWQYFRARRLDLETLNLDKEAFLLAAFADMERISSLMPIA
jgi:DNA polymerase III subunit delta'